MFFKGLEYLDNLPLLIQDCFERSWSTFLKNWLINCDGDSFLFVLQKNQAKVHFFAF